MSLAEIRNPLALEVSRLLVLVGWQEEAFLQRCIATTFQLYHFEWLVLKPDRLLLFSVEKKVGIPKAFGMVK